MSLNGPGEQPGSGARSFKIAETVFAAASRQTWRRPMQREGALRPTAWHGRVTAMIHAVDRKLSVDDSLP
jgi:hypothetical protein